MVARKDFAEKYPEIVTAYIEALMEANDWMRKNPSLRAEKIEEWTKIDKEVVYMFLGPGGVHTLDPTIKPQWVDAVRGGLRDAEEAEHDQGTECRRWVNDRYVRAAFKELGLDYDKQQARPELRRHRDRSDLQCAGNDPARPVRSGSPAATSSRSVRPPARCGVRKYRAEGKKFDAVYLVDHHSA